MDLDDFRSILDSSGVDVWTFIDTAVLVASLDYGAELKQRRDKIVERLYAISISNRCRNCDFSGGNTVEDGVVDVRVKETKDDETKEQKSPFTPGSDNEEEDDVDPYGGLFDDEQKRILEIKEQLEDPSQVYFFPTYFSDRFDMHIKFGLSLCFVRVNEFDLAGCL